MPRIKLDCKKVRLPQHTQFVIHWNKPEFGGGFACCLIGYCPDTLPYFLSMARALKAKLGAAIDASEITFSKVRNSSYNKGFTLAIAPIYGPRRKISGFKHYDVIDFGY